MLAVVIPCYKVKNQIMEVLSLIGKEVDRIYLVDDACPEQTGKFVEQHTNDTRVKVLYHVKNLGVGGATKTGYRQTLEEGADIVVKLDGDGQMDPGLIPRLIEPIRNLQADYVKGNRFYDLSFLREMPWIRRLGNSFLSFVNKLSSGYWNIMDPSNGFTAIHRDVLKNLPLEKIDDRFFFESDMLFRLNTIRAVVQDFPMKAEYGSEKSNLNVWMVLFTFPFKYMNRFCKRIFYNYYLRDFNIGSFELLIAFIFLLFGGIFGSIRWIQSIESMRPATAGTVLLASLPVILGFQSLLSFFHFDLTNIPQKPVSSMGI